MTEPTTTGPWKEGRLCAATLLYINPTETQMAWVAANHQAVGIRATVVGAPDAFASELRARNWDLREQPPEPGTAAPAKRSGVTADRVREHVAADKATGAWSAWEWDRDRLDTLGAEAHASLLRWLGEEHARVWCAPLRDIADWKQTHGS